MFNPSKDEVRRFFCDAWSKHRGGGVLTPLEAIAVDWIRQHPEYQDELADSAAAVATGLQHRRGADQSLPAPVDAPRDRGAVVRGPAARHPGRVPQAGRAARRRTRRGPRGDGLSRRGRVGRAACRLAPAAGRDDGALPRVPRAPGRRRLQLAPKKNGPCGPFVPTFAGPALSASRCSAGQAGSTGRPRGCGCRRATAAWQGPP